MAEETSLHLARRLLAYKQRTAAAEARVAELEAEIEKALQAWTTARDALVKEHRLRRELDAEAADAEYRVLHDAVSGGCDHESITEGVCDDCYRHVMGVKLPGGRVTYVLDGEAAERDLEASKRRYAEGDA